MRRRTALSAWMVAAAMGAAVVVSGCLFRSEGSPIADQSAAKRRMKEQPVQIIKKDHKSETASMESTAAAARPESTDTNANEDPAVKLMQALRRQEVALEKERFREAKETPAVESTQAAAVTVESTGRATPAIQSTASEAFVGEKTASVGISSTDVSGPAAAGEPGGELSVENLRAMLAAKDKLSPREEEAYRRLVGANLAQAVPPEQSSAEYKLLSDARDAVAREDYTAAREKVKQALMLIRRKTDPTIDRLCFATNVAAYGDATIVDPPIFEAGQRVLAVTDMSDFACLPVEKSSPPDLYYTKMSQRLVIYDTGGKLQWQDDYGTFEYQASHYISTMFIPQIFNLPSGMKSGEYVLKVEINDVLAGRQAEASVKFAVK